MSKQTNLRFFLDAGVPVSFGRKLKEYGHTVIFYNEALGDGVKDTVVCEAALKNDAILVAVDADMKQHTKRFDSQNERFTKLNLLMFSCNHVIAIKRLEQAMTLINHEWSYSQDKTARRLWLEVTNHYFKCYR